MDVDGFRILHRDLLDDLPDELIVKFRVARGAFHDTVPHLPASGSLFLQIAVVRQVYGNYRINRIGDYIHINRVGAVGLLTGMVVLVAFPPSPLFLSEQFTPTDIMELATALQLSGAIRRIDGTRVDLATLVDVLSGTFNVRINNPEQCRHTLINRKLRLTHFLDILRNNLIAYSQR